MNGSESLTSFTNRFFHFRRPPGVRLRLMRSKGMEDWAAFRVRKVKRTAAEEREKDEYYSVEGL